MRNYFKTFALLLLMAVCSMGAKAATVSDLVAIDYDYVFVADDVTSNGTVALTAAELYADGHIFAPTANTVAINKGNSTFAGGSHLNSLRIKGTQNALTFEVSGACDVTFYMQATVYRGLIVSKTLSDNPTAEGYQKQEANTAVWHITLPSAGVYYLMSYSDDPGNVNADLYFAGFEMIFPDDPAAVTFGVTREVASETSTSSDNQASGYAVAEDVLVDPAVAGISIAMNYPSANVLTEKGRAIYWFDGTETKNCYVDKGVKNYRNQLGDDVFKELNEGIYFSFDLTVADGYKLSLQRLISDVLKNRENAHYVVKIYNNGSLLRTFDEVEATATTSDMKRSIGIANDPSLQNLTGTVTVKLFFWNTASAQYVIIKDLQVKAIVSHIADGTQTFGLTRTVASVISTSSDELVTGYAVSDDALVDPSAEGITITKNFGSQNSLTEKGRKLYWYNEGKQDCYADQGTPNYRNYIYDAKEYVNALDERCYYGFDMTAELGKQVSIKMLTSDVFSDAGDAYYQVNIYNNGAVIKTLDVVGPNTYGTSDMKRVVNLSEETALQGLKGTVSVKLFWWSATNGKYLDVKDLNVAALVEDAEGEGVKGLVFTDFESAKNPTFTEGEVTASFSNANNNTISPATESRGVRMQSQYGITSLNVEVTADSYISEVVFVWNKKGNLNGGANFLDLLITNSSDVQVSTLQESEQKNETTWSCGEVRESELTFAQQTPGDFYCHSIRVTYLPKPTVQQYVRTHTHMNLNTLCYPYQIDSYTGATFYTMLYKAGGTAAEPAEIYLQEHVGALEAGKPYFYVPEGTELVCNYSGEYTAAGNDGNGTYGVYADMTDVASGMYVTYNNLFTKAGSNVKLREYRAYVDMSEVSVDAQGPSYIPRRRLLKIGNANAPQSPTDIENTSANFGGSEKILENGVLYILRDGKKYNVHGQMVK